MLRRPLSTASRRAFLAASTLLWFLTESGAIAQSFNATSVALTTRTAWCTAQIDTCQLICESAGSSVSDTENTCAPSTLSYTCTCENGFSPDCARYTETIPNFICNSVYTQCIAAGANDASSQAICTSEAEAFCVGFNSATFVSTFDLQTSTLSNGNVVTSGLSLTLFEAGGAPTSGSSGSSSSGPRSSTGSSSSTTTQPPPISSSAAPLKKPGISSGALAAAIAVPVIVIALLAVGFGIFVYRKRKAAKTAADAPQPSGWGKAELHGEHVPPTELPMQERFELQGEEIPGEVVGDGPQVHEMGGPTSPS